MTDEQVETILAELRETLNDVAGTHHFAMLGIRLARDDFERASTHGDPEADYFVGRGAPGTPESLAYLRWQIGSIPARLADDGPVAAQLGQQWAILIYTQWEHNYRPRLAAALSKEPAEITDDLMGDIRLLRNDIVHHHGIATKDSAGRCKVLTWFAPDDRILITWERVLEFMEHAGLTFRVE